MDVNNLDSPKVSAKLSSNSLIQSFQQKLPWLGPGIVMAGATIGISHLVQATRAGADFGLQLLGLVIIANVLKYPFFEFGHRYYAATGEHLLAGYKKLNPLVLYLFLALNVLNGLGAICALGLMTGSFLQALLPWSISPLYAMTAVLGTGIVLLKLGRYHLLDVAIKWLLSLLIIFTFIALGFAWGTIDAIPTPPEVPWQTVYVPFLVALMGWMPGPIEISVFQSLWLKARDHYRGHQTTLDEAKFDFNFGYTASGVMAVVFLMLGALVMCGQAETFSNQGAIFAKQVVSMYTFLIGKWVGFMIALAAFATLFSTALTILDAYPRGIAVSFLLSKYNDTTHEQSLTVWIAVAMTLASLAIVGLFSIGFKLLVDTVIIISFISAPVFAYMNYRLIYSKCTPIEAQGGRLMKVLSWVGLLYLSLFAIAFVIFMVV